MLTAEHTLTVDPDDGDDYIPVDNAHRYIPGRPHRSTVWRWASRGIQRDGERIVLKTALSGCRRFTRRDWIEEFLAACNGEPSPVASKANATSHRVAAAKLDALLATGRRQA